MPLSYPVHAADRAVREPRNPHGNGRYIPALDGWRAVAILLVMLFHSVNNAGRSETPLDASNVLATMSHLGALGVLIFFAISGYIITTRLHLEAPDGKISLRIFYVRRCFRILPAMWLYLITIVILSAFGVLSLERNDLFAPLFLTNYFNGSVYTAHFWSLAIEEHFYLLWPLCVLAAGWRNAIGVGCALMVAVGSYRAFRLEHLGVVDAAPGVLEGVRGYFLSHTEARIDYILAGCVLALLLIFSPMAQRFVARCGTGPGIITLLVIIVLSARVNVVDLRSLQAICIALAVVSTSIGEGTLVNRVLSTAPLVTLGKLSYSLYLWQQLLLARSSIGWLQSPIAFLPRAGCALLAAWLSYCFIERPMIKVGSRLIQPWKRAEAH